MQFTAITVCCALLISSVFAKDCECEFTERFLYGRVKIYGPRSQGRTTRIGAGLWYADVRSRYFKVTSSFNTTTGSDTMHYYRDGSNSVMCFEKQGSCKRNAYPLWVDGCVPGYATYLGGNRMTTDGGLQLTFSTGERGKDFATYSLVIYTNGTCQPNLFSQMVGPYEYYFSPNEGHDQVRDASFYRTDISQLLRKNLRKDLNLG